MELFLLLEVSAETSSDRHQLLPFSSIAAPNSEQWSAGKIVLLVFQVFRPSSITSGVVYHIGGDLMA